MPFGRLQNRHWKPWIRGRSGAVQPQEAPASWLSGDVRRDFERTARREAVLRAKVEKRARRGRR